MGLRIMEMKAHNSVNAGANLHHLSSMDLTEDFTHK